MMSQYTFTCDRHIIKHRAHHNCITAQIQDVNTAPTSTILVHDFHHFARAMSILVIESAAFDSDALYHEQIDDDTLNHSTK